MALPATQTVVGCQPSDDDASFGGGVVETLLGREVDELARSKAGLLLDVVEIGLE